jgi:CheY-like chemotaxis protein
LKKLLIIDDEPLVRRSLQRVLVEHFQIHEAQDGREGLDKWLQLRPDVVVLDVLMPALSGPQVLQQIPAEIRSSAKVILISAYTGEYNVDTARDLGADLFIAKPFDDIFAIQKQILKI